MATPKEIFLETLKADGKPERQLVQYEALAVQIPDPVFLYVGNGSRPGATVKNQWGVTILFPESNLQQCCSQQQSCSLLVLVLSV